ncbi:Cytochrome c, mono-and diheme variants [Chitinophaga sancti]|uniref:Cytochrome c, mono-and diheme variants n=1 Tax=Chitinophaga sancti TaxID=1004 RepID=A0A1K1S6F3_9BACT|nr:Cytochrome c, mono-and diheme variants [Chitinophaga sancti]
MKYNYLLALYLLSLLAFISCQQNVPLNGKLNTDKLPSQLVTINTSRDNYIKLSGGSIVQVPANALKTASGDSVKLEIKEAFTLGQMARAGLYTRSNGELLSSGGMLYIAPQAGQDVQILKPLKVIVPADHVEDDMQLFKGEIKDSAINWVDPQPLEMNKGEARLANGKSLYQSNCKQCHDVTKKLIGPALFGTMQRWHNDTAAVYLLTRNFAQAMQAYPQAACIYNEYKIGMPGYPSFPDEDLYDIYRYIQEEGMKQFGKIPEEYTSNKNCDSCEYIIQLAMKIFNSDSARFNLSYSINRSDVQSSQGIDSIAINFTPPVTQNAAQIPPVFYSFEILSFGWYNVDSYIKKNPLATSTKLKVVQEGLTSPVLFPVMVIPSRKIIQAGFLSSDGGYFYFYDMDGSIQLPPGERGYIFALGEKKDIVLFGLTRFVTGKDQTIKINIQQSNIKEVEAAINQLQLPDVTVNINPTGKAKMDQLKKELEELRKRYPNCLPELQ